MTAHITNLSDNYFWENGRRRPIQDRERTERIRNIQVVAQIITGKDLKLLSRLADLLLDNRYLAQYVRDGAHKAAPHQQTVAQAVNALEELLDDTEQRVAALKRGSR